MRKLTKIILISTVLFLLLTPLACSFAFVGTEGAGGNETLRIVNWNVQTFFDSKTEGCEYDEYIKSKTWGKEAYTVRVERLCGALKMLDADVVVLEELENEAVLHDISNFLSGEWNTKKSYSFACFAKSEGTAIGCGLLSRYPLENLSVHSFDLQAKDTTSPRMRPLMQVSVRKGKSELVLFINHWKSMSSGKEKSEFWRNRQEAVLSRQMGKAVALGKACLACGDFNRDILDFCASSSPDIILLRSASALEEKSVKVVSPWYNELQELIEPGSYYFNGEWSRIDNFFAAGNIEILDFKAETEGPWCESHSKIPEKYKLWNGYGYSDHLPISCTVRF